MYTDQDVGGDETEPRFWVEFFPQRRAGRGLERRRGSPPALSIAEHHTVACPREGQEQGCRPSASYTRSTLAYRQSSGWKSSRIGRYGASLMNSLNRREK